MAQAPSTDRPLRADARRNRERVLEAARSCFAEHGMAAQIDDVASEAGVGVGTIYRHFPTKEALTEAIAAERFRQLTELAREAVAQEDPWESLRGFLIAAAELQADDLALAEVMPEAMGRACQADHADELNELTAKLVERAQAAGVVRADLRPTDIPMLMCGLGRATGVRGGPPGSAQRYLGIMLEGLRAPGSQTLPD